MSRPKPSENNPKRRLRENAVFGEMMKEQAESSTREAVQGPFEVCVRVRTILKAEAALA
jgi:hypothetical protein